MKTVAIVQARMGSSRLPGKVMKIVAGQRVIDLLLRRLRQAETVDEIVLATTEMSVDDALCIHVAGLGTREHRGHVIPAITDRGHRAVVQPGNTGQTYGDHPAPPAHARWLEADWREDAAATRAVLEDSGADWLVMDHYALDRAWQQEALRAMA